MVTIGYIILGTNFFLIYVLSWIVGFFIYNGIHIYINYKRTKKKDYDINILENILILFGYHNYILLIYEQIEVLKKKIIIIIQPIKFWKGFYYNAVKRKYGAKQATKCLLSIARLIPVRKDNLIYDLKNKDIEYIYISKNKFFTDFNLKNSWYRKKNSIWENNMDDSFINTILKVNQLPNLYFFYLKFISDLLDCFVIEEIEINEENEKQCIKEFNEFFNKETKNGLYYFFYLKNFFEFKEINKFINIIEKKKNELGFEGFKIKLKEINYFIIFYNMCELYRNDELNSVEMGFFDFEITILFLESLDIEYNKKEYEDYFNYFLKEHDIKDDYNVFKEKIEKKIKEMMKKYNL